MEEEHYNESPREEEEEEEEGPNAPGDMQVYHQTEESEKTLEEEQPPPIEELMAQAGIYTQGSEDKRGAAFRAEMLPEEQEQQLQVIESISQGNMQIFKKVQFQAFSAAISHEEDVRVVLEHLSSTNRKFATAKNKVLAYRVNQMDEINVNMLMAEGYDDNGEEGAGEKLLRLLQKMGIENILIIVAARHNQMPGSLGADFFRMVLERARDLLTNLHKQILENERQDREEYERMEMEKRAGRKEALGSKVFDANTGQGLSKDETQSRALSVVQEQVEEGLANVFPEISAADYKAALVEIEEVGKLVSKSHVRELLSFGNPHPSVARLFFLVGTLKGYKSASWQTAKDFMSRPTFKQELIKTRPESLIPVHVVRSYKAYVNSKNLTPEYLATVAEGAALILHWLVAVYKSFAGYAHHGDLNQVVDPALLDDPLELAERTKVLKSEVLKQQKKKRQQLSVGGGDHRIVVPSTMDEGEGAAEARADEGGAKKKGK